MSAADEPLQTRDLSLLSFDFFLLFLDRVDQCDADAVVFHAFDFAFFIACDEQRLNRRYLLGAKADIVHAALFPVESDRPQAIDDRQPANERLDILFVAKTGRAVGDLIQDIATEWSDAGRAERGDVHDPTGVDSHAGGTVVDEEAEGMVGLGPEPTAGGAPADEGADRDRSIRVDDPVVGRCSLVSGCPQDCNELWRSLCRLTECL